MLQMQHELVRELRRLNEFLCLRLHPSPILIRRDKPFGADARNVWKQGGASRSRLHSFNPKGIAAPRETGPKMKTTPNGVLANVARVDGTELAATRLRLVKFGG